MGGCQLAHLALLHPRLFESLILIDPVIQGRVSVQGNVNPASMSARRRETWPSRADALASFKKSKFYQAWDERVLDLWVQHGLRDCPTTLFPDSKSGDVVTLTTTKHQEVMTFLRPNWAPRNSDEPSSAETTTSNPTQNRRTHPDLTPTETPQSPFYRGESTLVFAQLPHLRPSVFYIFGETSFLTADGAGIHEKMTLTGSGVGGSGGVKEGRVANVTVKGAGHLIPMEKVDDTARFVGEWIGRELVRWWDWEGKTVGEWEGRVGVERRVLTERFVEELGNFGRGRDVKL